jgi:gluconate 2-dehydrogenase gamma chain
MKRRDSLKLIATGAIASGTFIACEDKEAKLPADKKPEFPYTLDRAAEELDRDKALLDAGAFFTPHELATVTILADIIIPKDEVSGSASDAKVPEFIDFMMRDKPEYQTPMRGGLRWLDVQCLNRYEKPFAGCSSLQQMEMVDEIAWPAKAKPGMEQGVAFFNLVRNLTASGFYSSEMGTKDLGYAGNKPNQWNGVPADVLAQYNLAYTEKEIKECVQYS